MDGIDILYGEITREQLFYDFPDWKNIYDLYIVQSSILQPLDNRNLDSVQIEIFLGTWCGDSRREVPKFLKIFDETGLTNNRIRLFAVDKKKKLPDNLTTTNNIERVATFVFKLNRKEIGRIVEYPQISLESDIVSILSIVYDNENL
jgi:hypothetical protein